MAAKRAGQLPPWGEADAVHFGKAKVLHNSET
jgi:hypothetical protein